MSSRTSGGMLSALTSRVGNFVLHQNVSYRVALEGTNRTFFRTLADGDGVVIGLKGKVLYEESETSLSGRKGASSARLKLLALLWLSLEAKDRDGQTTPTCLQPGGKRKR